MTHDEYVMNNAVDSSQRILELKDEVWELKRRIAELEAKLASKERLSRTLRDWTLGEGR